MSDGLATTEKTVLVVGASRGIGLGFVRAYLRAGWQVVATWRGVGPELATLAATEAALDVVQLDVTDESSLGAAVEAIRARTPRLHRVINTAGVLHGDGFGPERRLEHIDADTLARVFRVNAYGPILLAKHTMPLLDHDEPSVFASLSARVGSIGDNHLGGWYAYRASKAAQNQFLKTLSVEWKRRLPHCAVLALHPGTVDTNLSAPFQRSVPEGKLFEVGRAVDQLRGIIEGATAADSGRFIAWDGAPIEW